MIADFYGIVVRGVHAHCFGSSIQNSLSFKRIEKWAFVYIYVGKNLKGIYSLFLISDDMKGESLGVKGQKNRWLFTRLESIPFRAHF